MFLLSLTSGKHFVSGNGVNGAGHFAQNIDNEPLSIVMGMIQFYTLAIATTTDQQLGMPRIKRDISGLPSLCVGSISMTANVVELF